MQDVLVGLIVVGCAFYATWALMPATLRRAAAARLARLPGLPTRLRARLQAIASTAPGGGCDGCARGGGPAAGPGTAPLADGRSKPVHFVRKPR